MVTRLGGSKGRQLSAPLRTTARRRSHNTLATHILVTRTFTNAGCRPPIQSTFASGAVGTEESSMNMQSIVARQREHCVNGLKLLASALLISIGIATAVVPAVSLSAGLAPAQGVQLTPIGHPTWRPVDFHLFAAPV